MFQVLSAVIVGSVVGMGSAVCKGTNHTASVVFVTLVRLMASFLWPVFAFCAGVVTGFAEPGRGTASMI